MRGVYIAGILALVVMTCNCDYYYFAKGVKEDTERIFKSKKSFFQSLSFKGIVIDKDKCEKCDINKFTVFIQIEEINRVIPFKDEAYSPYYSFNDKLLSLTVNQKMLEHLTRGELVNKKSHSRYFDIGNKQLELLNSEELIWLP